MCQSKGKDARSISHRSSAPSLPRGGAAARDARIALLATRFATDSDGGHSVEADRWGPELPGGAPGITVVLQVSRRRRKVPLNQSPRDVAFDRLIAVARLVPMPHVSCEICSHDMQVNGPQLQCLNCGHVLQALSCAAAA